MPTITGQTNAITISFITNPHNPETPPPNNTKQEKQTLINYAKSTSTKAKKLYANKVAWSND